MGILSKLFGKSDKELLKEAEQKRKQQLANYERLGQTINAKSTAKPQIENSVLYDIKNDFLDKNSDFFKNLIEKYFSLENNNDPSFIIHDNSDPSNNRSIFCDYNNIYIYKCVPYDSLYKTIWPSSYFINHYPTPRAVYYDRKTISFIRDLGYSAENNYYDQARKITIEKDMVLLWITEGISNALKVKFPGIRITSKIETSQINNGTEFCYYFTFNAAPMQLNSWK